MTTGGTPNVISRILFSRTFFVYLYRIVKLKDNDKQRAQQQQCNQEHQLRRE